MFRIFLQNLPSNNDKKIPYIEKNVEKQDVIT